MNDVNPLERLEELGVRGILLRLARDGQLVDVRCEMPQCYCPLGRRHFEQISPGAHWMPTADHYPRLKMHGGRLTADNVRLAHRVCNQRDYLWRGRIKAKLAGRGVLGEDAPPLEAANGSTNYGPKKLTAGSVRQAILS